MAEDREYGVELPGDEYEHPCTHECRLGCLERCEERGSCRLEVTPDRRTRARVAYWDNRRGVVTRMSDTGKAQVTIKMAHGRGLPYNDPVTIWGTSLRREGDPDLPHFDLTAEGCWVDGPHRLTLASLNARIEDYAVKRSKS